MIEKPELFSVDLHSGKLKGFACRIQDQFFETYAVILDGYHSCIVWFNNNTRQWQFKASDGCVLDQPLVDALLARFNREQMCQA